MATQQQPSAELKQQRQKGLIAALAITVIVMALIAFIGFVFLKPAPKVVEGQAEATSVKVSGKLPGRVMKFYVQEGDEVHAGDTLVHIHSSVADAQLYQAQSMKEATAAQNRKVDAGTRVQIVQAANDLWQQAKAARSIAEKTYNRMESLYNKGVISEQKRDEAKAAYDAAVAGESAAQSQYALAKSGAQKEDKESSQALVDAAQGNVMMVEALLQDQYLTAPCDGVIDVIYPNEGELVSLGAPIMNVLKIADKWVTFNVREELLNDLPMGKEIEVMIPALDKRKMKAKVYYIRDLGSYAVWRSTKSSGEWDSRTFQIKARPVESIPELRPGMSIVYLENND